VSPIELVRFAAPGISDDEADALLWGATGFPCFWSGPHASTPIRALWDDVQRAARIWRKGWLGAYIDAAAWKPTPARRARRRKP